MKVLKILLIVLGLFIAIVVIAYAFIGGFAKIDIQEKQTGGEVLVYQEMTGDYSKSALVMDQVYNTLLNDFKIETTKGFGEYYDNPAVVEKEKLRSDIGCILEPKDTGRVAKLEGKFKIKSCPEGNYIVTEFPFKSKLSVFVGIMRVYPAINKYIKEKGYSEEGSIMEIYDVPKKKIIYRKQINK